MIPDDPPHIDSEYRARMEADGWKLDRNMWETRAGGSGWPPHYVAFTEWVRPPGPDHVGGVNRLIADISPRFFHG